MVHVRRRSVLAVIAVLALGPAMAQQEGQPQGQQGGPDLSAAATTPSTTVASTS